MSRPVLLAAVLVLTVGAAVGGYLLGSDEAPDESPSSDSVEAFQAAYSQALFEALPDGRRQGYRAGVTVGRAQGERAGTRSGRLAGQAAAEATLVGGAVDSGGREPETGATSAGSGEVLVVGDSLEELTGPYLQEYLPALDLTISAVTGYSSTAILELLRESYDPSQSVIVFDAGTNDDPAYPDTLASNLEAVAEIVGDRCMVVPTIHAPTVNGVDQSGKNAVITAFASSRPGTQVPDWAGAVAANPELMQSDNLHPLPEGAALRGRLIARGIRACL